MATKPSLKNRSSDQNFKNLILDYPSESVAFFAPEEADKFAVPPRILPIRQEQLKAHLQDHFRELDTPLLARMAKWRAGGFTFRAGGRDKIQPLRCLQIGTLCFGSC